MGQHSPPQSRVGASLWALRPHWLPALALACSAGLWSAPAAAAIALNSIAVERDGTLGTFTADDAPGNDSGPHNGIVRAQDEVAFLVSYTATDTSNDTITLNLPTGMRFQNSATANTVCNVSGTLNAAKTQLTCVRKPAASGSESFSVAARVGAIAHGVDIATVGAGVTGFSASHTTPVSLPSGRLKVSATPKTQLFTLAESLVKLEHQGVAGRQFRQTVLMAAPLPAGESSSDAIKYKGFEALQTPFTVAVKVMPGAVLMTCNLANACSQPGGAGSDILFTFDSSARTDYLDPILYETSSTGTRYRPETILRAEIWTPDNPNFPVGVSSKLSTELTGFQVLGLSGASNVSNQPAHDTPGVACGTADNPWGIRAPSCLQLTVDRRVPLSVQGIAGSALYSSSTYLYGDRHGYTQDHEKLVPGQNFLAMAGRGNATNSDDSLQYSAGCMAWDSQWIELQGAASLHHVKGTADFYQPAHAQQAAPATGHMVIEYYTGTHANDADRRTFDCGTPGTAALNWGAMPADLSSVTAVRYAYEDSSAGGGLPPNSSLGLTVPMRRSVSAASRALATDTRMPWFFQYKDADASAAWVPSTYNPIQYGAPTGGGVQSVAARVRHVSAVPSTAVPNQTVTYSATPRIIGPAVAGIDTTAENVKVKITFAAQYLEFASAAPAGAVFTTGHAGVDGMWGTPDDEPSSAEFTLGDVTASGGAVTGGFQGHMTELAPLTFPLHIKANAPQGSYAFRSVISSDTDTSYEDYTGISGIVTPGVSQDRTEYATLVVSGVASFSVNKAITSGVVLDNPTDPASDLIITAGEPFTYSIHFANATTQPTAEAYFVDVLPFNGDGRGTTGLPSALKLLGVTAEMDDASWGALSAEYTTDAAASVLSAIQTTGNEHAATGVNWTALNAATIPPNATALRFKTAGVLPAGSSGKITVTVRADGDISSIGGIANDVYARTMDAVSPKVITGGAVAKVKGGRAAATLAGKVFNDANGNGVLDAGEAGIGGLSVTMTCEAGSSACVAGTTRADITDATGSYAIADLAAGKWTLSIPATAGWKAIASAPGSASGTAGVRQITGINIASAAAASDYLFAERQLGQLTVKKSLSLPSGVAGPFAFNFQATCDGSVYSASIADYPSTTSVVVKTGAGEDIPVGVQCTVTEDSLPPAPTGYDWAAAVVSPAGAVAVTAAGTTVSVTNKLDANEVGVDFSLALDLPAGIADSFSVAVAMTCDGKSYTESLVSGAAPKTVKVPANANCTVSSAEPSAPPANHAWSTPTINPASFTAKLGQSVPVAIGLKLQKQDVGVSLNLSLDVPTEVSEVFSVAVGLTCDGQSYSETLDSGTTSKALNLPANANCKVDSAVPSAAPANYRWETPSITPQAFTTEAGKAIAVSIALALVSSKAPEAMPVPVNAPLAVLLASLLLLILVARQWRAGKR